MAEVSSQPADRRFYPSNEEQAIQDGLHGRYEGGNVGRHADEKRRNRRLTSLAPKQCATPEPMGNDTAANVAGALIVSKREIRIECLRYFAAAR